MEQSPCFFDELVCLYDLEQCNHTLGEGKRRNAHFPKYAAADSQFPIPALVSQRLFLAAAFSGYTFNGDPSSPPNGLARLLQTYKKSPRELSKWVCLRNWEKLVWCACKSKCTATYITTRVVKHERLESFKLPACLVDRNLGMLGTSSMHHQNRVLDHRSRPFQLCNSVPYSNSLLSLLFFNACFMVRKQCKIDNVSAIDIFAIVKANVKTLFRYLHIKQRVRRTGPVRIPTAFTPKQAHICDERLFQLSYTPI